MYKKQRPKLSVTAVINSAQNQTANWYNGATNGCQLNGLTNTPTTRKFDFYFYFLFSIH